MPEKVKLQEGQGTDIEGLARENRGLMQRSFRKILLAFVSMMITGLIVIFCQGDQLFIFNFTGSNMNSTLGFSTFRLITVLFLSLTLLVMVFFVIAFFWRRHIPEQAQMASIRPFRRFYDLFDLFSVVPMFMALFVFVTGFLISPAIVEGSSMEPAYSDEDFIIIWHFWEKYSEEDVVIIDVGTELLIKRIYGFPGDALRIDASGVYLDDLKIEDFIPTHYVEGEGIVPYFLYEGRIPEGSYFVLGDNRPNSADSRMIGFIDESQLLGIVLYPHN